ncbi:isochorismatase family protein [Polaromonas sp.]|uniref:isochorismatase family protein n=1 Tax=Polaromonas sp. TaxID=1869339 RepID=UPI0025D18F6C|nr:isochorismatase family protein [Polaromonas sp.]
MPTANSNALNEEALSARGFGGVMGFGDAAALLVIDMMVGFTNPKLPLGSNLDAELENINRLVVAAEANKRPVFYSVVEYDDGDCRDSGIWGRKMSGLFTLRRGSESVALDSRLRMSSNASIFVKKYASCFFGTDLSSRLQAQRIDTLVIAGCSTSGCVRATVVDAVQHGFRPIVVAEAVGDRLAGAHEQALKDIQLKYGDVVSTDYAANGLGVSQSST